MKAVAYFEPGPIDRADALVDIDLPAPVPGPRDLLVRVQAVSVNPVDVKVRAAAPTGGGAKVIGWDAAGVVEAVGEAVTLFRPGDEVYYAGDITRPGSNAELQLVDERIVGSKPRSLDFAQAAALPLTAITAWELLFDRLGVPYGDKSRGGVLLVINGAGGVGSILLQIASRLTGLTVVATASRPESVAWCRRMGARDVIDHTKPLDQEMKRIGLPAADYVAALSGSDEHLPAIARLIAPQGRLCVIDDPKVFDIVPLKQKSITISWEMMFTRAVFQTPDMDRQHALLEEVAALVDAGLLATTLTTRLDRLDAANLKAAHALQESGRVIGKTVLALG